MSAPSKPTTSKAASGRVAKGPSAPGSASASSASKPKTASTTASSANHNHNHASAAPSSAPSSSSQRHPLQKYREIFVARSDGVGYTTQQINDASRSAQPVGDALDDSHDYVRSWTVKLGKAIKYNLGAGVVSNTSSTGTGVRGPANPNGQLATQADPTNYLVRLPEGYSLHIRSHKERNREAPMVFGHPLGPIAAFRSPAELALHILWLLSDSMSRADCSCRLCVRMVSDHQGAAGTQGATQAGPAEEAAPPAAAAATAGVAAAAGTAPSPTSAAASTAVQPSSKPAPSTTAAASTAAAASPAVTPVPVPTSAAPAQAAPAPTPAPTVTPVPVPKPPAPAPAPAQPVSTAPNPPPVAGGSSLFRPWELVWYQHVTSTQYKGAWRLGIVLQIVAGGSEANGTPTPANAANAPATPSTAPPSAARVAPLGVTGLHPAELTLALSELRPFLSFSVPAMREGFQGLSFDAVNWTQLAQEAVNAAQQQQAPAPGRYDTATIALEASKAAANQINACFSVFNAKPKASPTQCIYGGVFLGAEQIVVGDAVRVGPHNDATSEQDPNYSPPGSVDIMRVNLILTDHASLRFIGDVYRLVQGPATTPQPEGAVFAEEVAERNRVTGAGADGSPGWSWLLKERNGNRAEHEVHGRFYVSMRLATNLQNAAFLQEAAAGRVTDGMMAALNRRQLVGGFRYEGKRVSRGATIGAAVSVALPRIQGVVEEV